MCVQFLVALGTSICSVYIATHKVLSELFRNVSGGQVSTLHMYHNYSIA